MSNLVSEIKDRFDVMNMYELVHDEIMKSPPKELGTSDAGCLPIILQNQTEHNDTVANNMVPNRNSDEPPV